MASNTFKMNLNEYMVALEKPVGIRFAIAVDGKIFVHALKKGGNAEKSRIVMVGNTLKRAGSSSEQRLHKIKDFGYKQQAKDVVKGIKKRLGSRNSKVQLLALTLLETIIKNCGDVVQMHVAERDLLHDMVKIVKKKPDYHVKEKILILIDTWQEAFGGPRARYPQYYAAYQEMLRAGAVFPQRSEVAAPVFTPPQTQPLSSLPQNLNNPDHPRDIPEPTNDPELPTLTLTEIQNARGIMDVLS